MGATDGDEESGAIKQISLTIKFPNADDIVIKCKPNTPFSKIYKAVAGQRGIAQDSFVLQWDHIRLGMEDTPKMHEFEEEEQIDYHAHQIGGGRL
ncbi:hypothetical protein T439DRAFT_320120 [Meredithblackwellia eburnea MCA 4105]